VGVQGHLLLMMEDNRKHHTHIPSRQTHRDTDTDTDTDTCRQERLEMGPRG